MSYVISYDARVEEDLKQLRRFEQRRVMDAVDGHLRTRPTLPTRRKKLLTGLVPPWNAIGPVWQLRVGDFRVFYDVDQKRKVVIVRAVRRKGTRTTEEIL